MNEGTHSGKSTICLKAASAVRPTNSLYLYLYLCVWLTFDIIVRKFYSYKCRFFCVLKFCVLCNSWTYRLRWSRGSVLAFSTQVRGFKPGWSHWIFKGEKTLSMPSFRGEVKPSVPCRRFTACKRTLECIVEVGLSRQNYRSSFSPTNISTFRCLELSRRVRCGDTSGSKSGNS